MSANKIKHLEFIQAIITRMAGNSFLIKGWSVTLIAAILALSAAADSNKWLVPIAFVPALIFWFLDAYFLHQEKKYRKFWNIVRKRKEDQIEFEMGTQNIDVGWYLCTIFSKTIWPFHLALLSAVIIATLAKFGYLN